MNPEGWRFLTVLQAVVLKKIVAGHVLLAAAKGAACLSIVVLFRELLLEEGAGVECAEVLVGPLRQERGDREAGVGFGRAKTRLSQPRNTEKRTSRRPKK